MSLNGLDTPDVLEAAQTAAIEPAGWFLLNYITRDSVGLLAKGKAGVGEARNAITAYKEASPLYGLIMYRRRKILIKYIPEGTSRLLQARTAVHLQDILERYSPYETLLELAKCEDLNDTALAASFPLHTASQSVASNRLREISEDGEEVGTAAKPRSTLTAAQRFRERKAEHALKSDNNSDKSDNAARPPIQVMTDDVARPSSPRSPLSSPTRRRNFSRQFMASAESGHQSISTIGSASDASTAEAPLSEKSAGETDPAPISAPATKVVSGLPSTDLTLTPYSQGSSDRPRTADVRLPTGMSETSADSSNPPERHSLSKLRPLDENDPYDIEKFFKPKVKLGPRPVADGQVAKRSSAAGIASVPATYRPQQQKQRQSSRMPQQDPITSYVAPPSALNAPLPLPPPVPTMPEYNPRPVSRGSIKSLPTHKSTAMTPDKLRLMKAVEMRKKKMRQANATETASLAPSLPEAITPVSEVPEQPDEPPVKNTRSERIDENKPAAVALSRENDSGIEMEYEKLRASEDTSKTNTSTELSLDSIPKKIETAPIVQDQKLGEQRDTSLVALDATPGAFPRTPDLEDKEMSDQKAHAPTGPSGQGPQQKEQESANSAVESGVNTQELIGSLRVLPQAQDEVAANDANKPETEAQELTGPIDPPPPQEHQVPANHVNEIVPQAYSQLTGSGEEAIISSQAEHRQSENGVSTTVPATVVPTIVMPDLPSAEKKSDHSDPTTPVQAPRDLDSEDDSPDLGLPLQNPDLSVKRRGMVEPLSLNTERELSSDDDDDDELLEELHAVTLQDARSVTVSKSPVARFFTRRPSATSAVSESNSVKKDAVDQDGATISHDRFVEDPDRFTPSPSLATPISLRSTTSPLLEKNDSLPPGIRRNVSTGISKRIQALAEQSSRESNLPTVDGAMRGTGASLKSRGSTYQTPSNSRESTSDGPASANTADAAPTQSNQPTWSTQVDPVTNQEAVSVSARIVPPRAEVPADTATTTTTTTTTTSTARPESSLRQSHLILNHSRGTSHSTTSTSHTAPQRSESRTSSTSTSSAILSRTFGRHRAQSSIPTAEQFPAPPSHTTNDGVPSTSPGVSNDENSPPKDGTRTSRFFKRVSNLGSKRKTPPFQSQSNGVPRSSGTFDSGTSTMSSATLTTMREDQDGTTAVTAAAPPAITVGNLNVQFPDTLLWKRRILSIDVSGNLTFSIPQAMEHQKSLARKFPLVDFRQPYIPDLDRQELPNSVMLDFRDGSTTLQAACEDGVAQREIIGVLRAYWRAWNGV